ncbi:hypothetical protein FA15DRAFT_740891 [Coprinopsis marcescibilis]|uniref:(4-O-methyl)-D-glucuronate--lignin esterase n=1 Tax=Coprinopsis marcescibilis TaxID=230819 RepID=A0A5C3KVJ6_COPMA|nr:hypothetical protein FA15DRAFT_740891 [Coprinopsis marcescibilis]
MKELQWFRFFSLPLISILQAGARPATVTSSKEANNSQTNRSVNATGLQYRDLSIVPPDTARTPHSKLPNPFTFFNGRGVVTKDDWYLKRQEISSSLQRLALGELPVVVNTADINATISSGGKTLTVSVRHNERSTSFSSLIEYPSGDGPFPAIIALGGSSIPTPSGVALIRFNNDEIGLQVPHRSRGKFYDLYGHNHTAGIMNAWAWAVSRIIDGLVILPRALSKIDNTKLAVTGCSRNAKGALIAAAYDQRVALTITHDTGAGGTACWRISEEMVRRGLEADNARKVVASGPLFSTSFNQYVDDVDSLPFDHHFLPGLIAPRGLLVLENSGIPSLGPQSVYGCMVNGRKIFQALGVSDHMGISQVGNRDLCRFPQSQRRHLDAFVNKFLHRNIDVDTEIEYTDIGDDPVFNYTEGEWVDWSTPKLI